MRSQGKTRADTKAETCRSNGARHEVSSAPTPAVQLLGLQSTLGNRAVTHLLGTAFTSTRKTAERGVAGAGAELPFRDRIQSSFGRHDLSPVRASIGGAAREAGHSLGALAYTSGERIGFSRSPDLFTAAHEAAHVIQQRSGVAEQGVGRPGGLLERHADRVAESVIRGVSAEQELDRGIASVGGAPPLSHGHAGSVQLRLDPKAPKDPALDTAKRTGVLDQNENDPSFVDLEVKLAAVIRKNEISYMGAVSQVTTFWRSFVQSFKGKIGTNESNLLLHGLQQPELATPEFLQQKGPASISNEHALQRWEDLADSALNSASVDLHMFFLKTIFESFLDKKSPWRSTSQEILASSFDPEIVRKRPAIAPDFEKRGRRRNEEPPVLEAIIGNKAVDPGSRGKTKTVLQPEDPAYAALVHRGTDVQLFNPKAPFSVNAMAQGLPLAAGISGSAADFVMLARMARLQGQALKNFAMAIIYYIVLPGHHSFHEVASVLAGDGIVSYRPKPGIGDYSGPLTDHIKNSDAYKALAKEYPGRL